MLKFIKRCPWTNPHRGGGRNRIDRGKSGLPWSFSGNSDNFAESSESRQLFTAVPAWGEMTRYLQLGKDLSLDVWPWATLSSAEAIPKGAQP